MAVFFTAFWSTVKSFMVPFDAPILNLLLLFYQLSIKRAFPVSQCLLMSFSIFSVVIVVLTFFLLLVLVVCSCFAFANLRTMAHDQLTLRNRIPWRSCGPIGSTTWWSVLRATPHSSEEVNNPQNEMGYHRLLRLMEEDKPHLDTTLSSHSLAKILYVSTRTLSRILSHHAGQSYHEFVNTYRLREALHLLRAADYAHLSITELASRAGFNSKGAFYRVFKENMGESPAKYRARHIPGS